MPRLIQPVSNISKAIKEYRELTDSSIKAYTGSLRMLYKTLNPEADLTEELSLDFLDDFDGVMDIVNKMEKITTKKNRLTAVLVALQSSDDPKTGLVSRYANELTKLGKKYAKLQDKQEKTETQERNWIEMSDFVKVINTLMDEVKIAKKKWVGLDKLPKKDYILLQSLVLLTTYQQMPLRNDFADMRVLTSKVYEDLSDSSKDSGNFLLKDKGVYTFKINKYKNVRRLGRRSYKPNKKLIKLLNLWFKFNKSDYFLTLQNQQSPLSRNGLTKLLQSVMLKHTGKRIGSSMLRHIQISHDNRNDKSIDEKKKEDDATEDKFLHSANQNDRYRKL